MFSLSLTTKPIEDFVTRLGREYPAATARGLNRTATSERAVRAREIASNMGVKVGVAKDAIRLERATRERQVAKLITSGKRIALIDMGARGTVPSRGRGNGVSYRNPGGGRGRISDAFIAKMASGHVGVFKRNANAKRHGPAPNRSQLPIHELFGPSIAVVFAKLAPAGEQRLKDTLLKNVQSEVTYALSKGA